MKALLYNLVLRVVGISSITPTAEDVVEATRLTLGSEEAVEKLTAPPTGAQEGPSMRLAKLPRQDLAPEETTVVHAQAANIAARLVGLAPVAAQGKNRRRMRKACNQGPKKAAEVAEMEIVHVDNGSPVREERVDQQVIEVEAESPKGDETPAEIETQVESERGPDTLVGSPVREERVDQQVIEVEAESPKGDETPAEIETQVESERGPDTLVGRLTIKGRSQL